MDKKNNINIPYLIIIAGLILIIIYLFSGGSGDDITPVSPQPTNPQSTPGTVNEPVLYTEEIPQLIIPPGFAGFFPENISGMRRVTLLIDSMDSETEGRFSSYIEDNFNVLYLSNSVQADREVEYSVYKMKSPEAANEVLEYYTIIQKWNTKPKQFEQLDNFTFWIWEGYLEGIGRPEGIYFYWDSIKNESFLLDEKISASYIAQAKTRLFCLHGEAVYGEYFIMVDVHAPQENIIEFSDMVFEEAAKQITSNTI
ncbi:MAG: hypothetical protein KAJ93_07630 [Methanosarcinales archaeon]|nr:hypothetical protein [Methanosarcinales archaeon]